MKTKLLFAAGAAMTLMFGLTGCSGNSADTTQNGEQEVPQKEIVIKYGMPVQDYEIKHDTIQDGETIGKVLDGFGFSAKQIHDLTQNTEGILDVRKIRPGQACALLTAKDSASTPQYFVYEDSPKSFILINLQDSYRAERKEKPVEWRECETAGRVNSSLWYALKEANASPILAVEMSNIFGWSVDFFGVQKDDEFRIIYSQEFVEGKPLNNYRILATSFKTSGTTVYAIPFTQNGEELFYNENGNSLESAFLKAPLDYFRITSKFSHSRLHPVLKIRRPHHGVDYAAPVGTPVYAIGSGKVIKKAYQRGGAGYYLKIRHNNGYVTTYMHLSRFAAGLNEGDHVKQKQVIGYVGSTGVSTGPHLDFRVHENGKPIDPLSIKSTPKVPISKANRAAFEVLRDSVVNRLTNIEIATVEKESVKIDSAAVEQKD